MLNLEFSLLNLLLNIKEPVNKMERLDRSQWKQYQNLMQDSNKFVDLMHSIDWEDGLPNDISQSSSILLNDLEGFT